METEEQCIECAPVFFIESDWEHCLRQVSGKVWISCKFKDSAGYYGKIVRLTDLDDSSVPNLKTVGDFSIDSFTSNSLAVTYLNYKCFLLAPINVYSDIHSKSVKCLSVSETSLCVSVSSDNELEMLIWNKENGNRLLSLKGHVGDVYKCKWFPSNIVILSASSDMTLKIWCAKTGKCAVTLIGHTQAVTDVCIVERGRNVISVSKDGTCKLWDCGEKRCLDNLLKVTSAIYCCTIIAVPENIILPDSPQAPSEREIGTENKIVLVGCEDGNAICLAVRSRCILFSLKLDSAVNCCCAIGDQLFAVGYSNGKVALITINGTIRKVWFETNSPVISITPYEHTGLFCGHRDGSCIFRSILHPDSHTRIQLTGPQDDPIYDISCDNKSIYTACRDSAVRRYLPQSYIKQHFTL